MKDLPVKRLLVYLVFGVLVLAGGVWGLTSTDEEAGASEVLLVRPDPGQSPDEAQPPKEALPSAGGARAPSDALPAPGGPASGTATTMALIYVQVAGAVQKPGVYEVPAGSRVFEVLKRAGGATTEADEQALSLAAPLQDGARVYVPRRGEEIAPPPVAPGGTGAAGPGTSSSPAAPVSLSNASQTELETLPGIGPRTAERIIAYREQNGPFGSVEELEEVSGIGPAILERLRPLVVP